jgi:hypothetical protein
MVGVQTGHVKWIIEGDPLKKESPRHDQGRGGWKRERRNGGADTTVLTVRVNENQFLTIEALVLHHSEFDGWSVNRV